jgi:hypothetical protein
MTGSMTATWQGPFPAAQLYADGRLSLLSAGTPSTAVLTTTASSIAVSDQPWYAFQ